jgi:tRNA nucleotidyltransferase (CCA-adding enzyme)
MPLDDSSRTARKLSKTTLKRRLGRRRAELAAQIGRSAAKRGWDAFLVGGVVRDLLLSRPSKDLDLVVVGDAADLAAELAGSSDGRWTRHRAFGTATVELDGGLHVDLATARSETYARPAALPRTTPSDLLHDLQRRDFTINSMALDVSPAGFGVLVDPGGGASDLGRRRIRALHDRSFLDDPTRAFRAMRLANRLDFEIEPCTAAWMRQAVDSGVFERLSGSRVRRELWLQFEEGGWANAATLLARQGIWVAALDLTCVGRTAISRLGRAEGWADWYTGIEHGASFSRWVLALAALTYDESYRTRQRLAGRLRPGRGDARGLVDAPDRARGLLQELRRRRRPRPSHVLRACEGLDVVACLLALAATRAGSVSGAIQSFLQRSGRLAADISGGDLLRAGVPPGPRVGRGLRAALEAKLDGRADDRRDQLAVALRASRRRA